MIREERRKHFRFDCSCFGEARYQKGSVEKISVKNISSEGLKILTSYRELSVGDRIEVRVDIPGKKVPPLISGQIKWIDIQKESTELGIQLKETDKETKKDLTDYGFSVWRSLKHREH